MPTVERQVRAIAVLFHRLSPPERTLTQLCLPALLTLRTVLTHLAGWSKLCIDSFTARLSGRNDGPSFGKRHARPIAALIMNGLHSLAHPVNVMMLC